MFWVCPKVGDPQIYSIMGKMMISHWIRQSHFSMVYHTFEWEGVKIEGPGTIPNIARNGSGIISKW